MEAVQSAEPPDRLHASTSRILLVDPDVVSSVPITREFRVLGCEVIAAKSTREALEAVSRNCIDFALLELKFDDGDGLGLIPELRFRNPSSRIVVHTWFADVKATVAVIKAGADDLLPKPLNAEFVVDFVMNGNRLGTSGRRSVPDADSVRRAHIEAVFRWSGRNISLASRRLSLNRRSLQRLIQRYRETE